MSGEWDDDYIGAVDINPFNWISAAADGALKGGLNKAKGDLADVLPKAPKSTPKQKVKKVYVKVKEKAKEVQATGEWKTLAYGAGIALGAVTALKAILKP